MSLFGGIDPGVRGALALWDSGLRILYLHDMPVFEHVMPGKKTTRLVLDEGCLWEILQGWQALGVKHVGLEHVSGMPGQSGPAAFTFGACYGALRLGLIAAELPFTPYQPVAWKAAMRVRKVGDPRAAKEASRQRASEILPAYASLWPRKGDADRAEAALIALHCARLNGE